MTAKNIAWGAAAGAALAVASMIDVEAAASAIARVLAADGAAEWASAIVSAFAVATALFISVREGKRAMRAEAMRRRESERDAARAGAIAMALILVELESLQGLLKRGAWTEGLGTASRNDLERYIARLEAIPLHALPVIDMARDVILVAAAAHSTVALLDFVETQGAGVEDVPSHLVDRSLAKAAEANDRYLDHLRCMSIPWKY